MNSTIILFHFPRKTDHNIVNTFMQRFYGQDSTSWGGKYRYHRRGLLEDIPHRKLLRGVVILRNEDVPRVVDFLGSYSLTLHIREVRLTQEDKKILGETYE